MSSASERRRTAPIRPSPPPVVPVRPLSRDLALVQAVNDCREATSLQEKLRTRLRMISKNEPQVLVSCAWAFPNLVEEIRKMLPPDYALLPDSVPSTLPCPVPTPSAHFPVHTRQPASVLLAEPASQVPASVCPQIVAPLCSTEDASLPPAVPRVSEKGKEKSSRRKRRKEKARKKTPEEEEEEKRAEKRKRPAPLAWDPEKRKREENLFGSESSDSDDAELSSEHDREL